MAELIQKATIEERVTLLEIQVGEIEQDVTDLGGDVTVLEGNVNFLFDETVIQDERILILEQDSDIFDDEIESEYILSNSYLSYYVYVTVGSASPALGAKCNSGF